AAGAPAQPADTVTAPHLPAALADRRPVGRCDQPVVDHDALRDVQRADAADGRLDLGDLLRADLPDGQPVGPPALGQAGQAGQLAVPGGDDQLAGLPVRDLVRLRELHHGQPSRGAEPRLQAAWLVVEAGVDDPGVVAAL